MSLTATGWCQLEHGTLSDSGVVKTKPDDWRGRRIERCSHIIESFESAVLEADLVAIEAYAFSQSRGHDLGELGGILRYKLIQWGIPYIELTPGEWRKYLFGKGNIVKDQLRLATYKKFNLEFEDQNTVEAFGIAMTAHLMQQENSQ